jgi:GTP-binding protein EngB required for normal cell division
LADTIANLTTLSKICRHFGVKALEPQVQACERLLSSRDRPIDIAIFGRFKAGKSSFLNNLVGKDVLPVGVTPVTTVITRLRAGRSDEAVIRHLNGTKQKVPLERVAAFVSENENPGNSKAVESATIILSELAAFEGLQFIDTPGLGSVFKHNTEASLSWLPLAGVALVAISVDPPLSEQDIQLIDELRKYTPNIVILLTKADLLDESQRNEVEQFIHVQLKKKLGTDFRIYPYSVRKEGERFRKALVLDILLPLAKNRENEIQGIFEHKFRNAIRECRDYLNVANRAAEKTDNERERLRLQILGEKDQRKAIFDEIELMRREISGNTRLTIMKRFSELQPEIEDRLKVGLTSKLREWRMRLWSLTRTYEAWLEEAMTAELAAVSEREHSLFHGQLKNAETAFARVVESFENRLATQITNTLGVSFSKPAFQLEVRSPRSPHVSAGRVFDTPIDILSFMIPMFLFRSLFHRHFLNEIPFAVEKHLSRLASGWTENINEAIQHMATEAKRFIANETETIDELLVQKRSNRDEIELALKELERLLQS